MSSLHILVAEDDRHLAALLRQTLEIEGFDVTLALDGQEALAKVETHLPDAIILDAMMPAVDGFEVLAVLKATPAHRDIPVLMLTGMRNSADVQRAIAAGAADYLTKPFRPDHLVLRVRRLVEAEPVRTRLNIDSF